MDIYSAAAHLYSAIPPELRAALSQKLVEWGVHAYEEAQGAAQGINEQEALYKWYLEEFVEHFSTIEALDQLVPFTGSLGVDRFLLWPELDEETRRSIDKPNGAERDRQPPLPRKLKATELLTHPLGNNRLFAVEGAAGVGKTTMARALARFAATQTLELMERENEDGSQVQYLPLYFNAEDLIKLAESTPVGQVSPSGEGALKDLLGGVLQKPNRALLVIVDGLDEVEGPIRTKALNVLRGLWLPGGNHRYLLLGRPGSISNVPWVREEKEVLKHTLKPWGEEEVREYLGRWTDAGGRPHLEAAELDQLVEYMRSRVGLPSPALLVQMVVASYVELKRDGLENPLEQMPATRTELYRNYLRLLLERSEGDKALRGAGSTAHPADLEQRKWLGCLELLLRLSPKQRERARAQKCSANHLPDVAAARARGRSCGKLLREEANFTKWWEDRKLCRLGHESLHEFLAAEALARLYRGDPKGFWKDWLHPSIFDPYWQQTLIFAMALMDEEDQSALMRGLLALGSCDPVSELTGRHLEVMAKAWGAGVQYDPAVWQGWLDNDPRLDLLVTVASNAGLRSPVQRALERVSIDNLEEDFLLNMDWQFTDVVNAAQISTTFLEQVLRDLKAEILLVGISAALLKIKPDLAIPALERLAREGNSEYVRCEAAAALMDLRPELAIPALEQLAREGQDDSLRLKAAEALGKPNPELAAPILERMAQEEEDGWLRREAVEALGQLGPAAVLSLEKLAQESEDDLGRREIINALGQVGPESIPALTRLAKDAKDEDLRLLASARLGEIGPMAAPAFEQLARSAQNKQDRLGYAEVLVKLKPNAALPILERLLRESNERWLWFRAANALRKVGSDAIPTLEWMIKNAMDRHGELWASKALVGLKPYVAIPILERLAREGNSEYVRCEAAAALMDLRPELAIPALEQLAREGQDDSLRIEAAEALGKLNPELAAPILERMAQEEEDGWLRREAVEALGQLGSMAIPVLERLAQEEEDEWIRQKVKAVLESTLRWLSWEWEDNWAEADSKIAKAILERRSADVSAVVRLVWGEQSGLVQLSATEALRKLVPKKPTSNLKRLVSKVKYGTSKGIATEAAQELEALGVPPIGCEKLETA